jgi:peptide/nickel transport system permease protein
MTTSLSPSSPATSVITPSNRLGERTLKVQQPLWARLLKNRRTAFGLIVLALFYAIALLAPWLAPHDPNGQVLLDRLKAPSFAHPFGTDALGRDLLSRAIYGTRLSLSISFVAMLLTIVLGTLVGLVSGYVGGFIDSLLMRITDLFLAFPVFLLLITVVAIFGSSIRLLVLFMGLTAWPVTARTVRAEVLSYKRRDFIDAARVEGATATRILLVHLLPNIISVIVVAATLRVASVILVEASLSYFGLGVAPPDATWGNMVADGRQYLARAWWITTFPGSLIVITVFAYNLLGEGLRDELDPRRRRR